MHNQHRSPDPTKIERATATSTVALFFYFLSSIWLYLFIFFLSVKSSLVPYIVSMDISSNERMPVISIMNTPTTRPQNQLNATKEQHEDICNILQGASVTLHIILLLLPISMETTHDPKEPVLLIALKIMRHAKSCLLVIMFLICVCWHPERMCRGTFYLWAEGAILTC